MRHRSRAPLLVQAIWIPLCTVVALLATGGCGSSSAGSNGPATQGPTLTHQTGNAANGQAVFRSETFGNEGFWTDAMQLPQGIVAAKVTPVQALMLGLSVNVDALDSATKTALANEIAAQGTSGPILNDPATTIKLINANAVIGVVVKDTNGDGVLDVTNGDKAGVSCAVCHAISDGSVIASPNNLGGGGIGKEIDGAVPHNLQVGKIFAVALNSRAYYPLLQLQLNALGGKSIGRAPATAGITATSSEADVDAYLSNPAYYPPGSFDDAPDGVGAPQHIQPLFRTDLSAPFGTPGNISSPDNFANLVYTALLDPTTLTTPGGRNFLKAVGGDAGGQELADNYVAVLTATGVKGPGGTTAGTGFPFITASLPAGVTAGSESAPLGVRVDSQKLLDMNAYTDSLPAPKAPAGLDTSMIASGKNVFRTNCTTCHNVDQSVKVPTFIVAENQLLTAYNPTVLAQRPVELPFRPTAYLPVQDDPTTIFDDKTIFVDASERGDIRGSALPLLLDLARKDKFLHDSSVTGLSLLLDPARGAVAPHAFFITDTTQRAQLVQFLESLED